MFVFKIDDEISLKMPELSDAEILFALTDANRTHLREWLPWVDHTIEVEDTEAYIKNSMIGNGEGTLLNTLILYKGEMCGAASFNKLDEKTLTAYIGYWIAADYEGHGIMTRVVHALMKYAFEERGMEKVEIRAAEDNVKSRAVAERLNFKKEGIIRHAENVNERFLDHAVYGMLKDEFRY